MPNKLVLPPNIPYQRRLGLKWFHARSQQVSFAAKSTVKLLPMETPTSANRTKVNRTRLYCATRCKQMLDELGETARQIDRQCASSHAGTACRADPLKEKKRKNLPHTRQSTQGRAWTPPPPPHIRTVAQDSPGFIGAVTSYPTMSALPFLHAIRFQAHVLLCHVCQNNSAVSNKPPRGRRGGGHRGPPET